MVLKSCHVRQRAVVFHYISCIEEKTLGTPTKINIHTLTYREAVNRLLPIRKYPGVNDMKLKFSSAYAERFLPFPAIKIMRNFLEQSTGTESNFFFLNWGGAVSRKSPKVTAFFWRNPKYYLEWNASWNSDASASKNLAMVEQTRRKLKPYVVGSYVNVPDVSIKDYGLAYYGFNFARLRKVKAKYDPNNGFRFSQSIPPE